MLYTDICLGIFVVIGSSISTTKDSLLNIIGSPVEFSLQIEIYRGLADFYFEKPEEVDYLNKMYFTAKAVNDKTHMFETLSDLVFSYIKVYHADSVWYYMSLLNDVGTLEESHPYLFFLRMRLFAGRVRNNEVETAITEELAFMGKENIGGNDIYIQMEQTFITGYALCSEGKYEEADPYLETAYKLACQLPYEEGFKFRICTVWNFLSTLNFIDKGDLYIEYVEK